MSNLPLLWAMAVYVASLTVMQVLGFADEDNRHISAPQRLDPAAWGDDHVGKEIPEYVTGDECLFCHRTIGPTWPDNRHQLTIRSVSPDQPSVLALRKHDVHTSIASDVDFVMGDSRAIRFLKRSKAYGLFDLLSAKYVPDSEAPERNGAIIEIKTAFWDSKTFGRRCAGCHATAVHAESRSFSATSIDCFACHGSVDLAHTKNNQLVLLSKTNREPREVISICGQCHLRGGKSKSSGLPYPNTFVAGDNLFRDFNVDLSSTSIENLKPVDRHIFENTRDVVIGGRTETTCLSCHDIHRQASEKHQELVESERCTTCHEAGLGNGDLSNAYLKSIGPLAHSHVCDY